MKIEFDKDLCASCEIYVDARFVDVYRWDDKKEKPVLAYSEDGVCCDACEMACSLEHIEVKPTGTRLYQRLNS